MLWPIHFDSNQPGSYIALSNRLPNDEASRAGPQSALVGMRAACVHDDDAITMM